LFDYGSTIKNLTYISKIFVGNEGTYMCGVHTVRRTITSRPNILLYRGLPVVNTLIHIV